MSPSAVSATRHLERLLRKRFRYSLLESNDLAKQIFYSFAVGVITGFGSILFRYLIDWFHHFFFEVIPSFQFSFPVIISSGGLIVGLILFFLANGSHSQGIPAVITSVFMNGGKLKGRVAILKMITSAITIGSGGSAGREGPIVLIGAALGSKFGQILKLSEDNVIHLVVCGAAAGIAATFNAPLAGVFFALEVILGQFSVRSFGLVTLSSVTASAIGRYYLGNHPAFETSSYTLVHHSEYGWYLLLGLIAGIIGLAFTRSLYLVEDIFDNMSLPSYVKPALGGFIVGIIALYFPEIMGNGYDTITMALSGVVEVQLLTALIFIKIIATSLTLGSGGSGGDLAPSLYIGAVLGGAYGFFIHSMSPLTTESAGAYALVGMAAVFASSARAPMTAVLMVFELTTDYYLILPLMAATVISTMVSSLLDRDSIYSYKLTRSGLDIFNKEEALADPMRRIFVREVMGSNYKTINSKATIKQLEELFNSTGFHAFPIINDKNVFCGMVTYKDLEYARMRNHDLSQDTPVTKLSSTPNAYVCPDDSLALALRTMGKYSVGRLPVLDSGVSKNLLGLLSRADIVAAYNKDTGKVTSQTSLKVRTPSEAEFLEVQLPNTSPLVGMCVKDIPIPSNAVLVAVRRQGKTIIPRGGTSLEYNDVVVTFCQPEARETLRQLLTASSPAKAQNAEKIQEKPDNKEIQQQKTN